MRIFTILSLLSLMSLLIVSCSSIKFSTENVLKVHQGMSSDEILALFGKPKNIGVSVCGQPPNQWTCTAWEYGGGDFDFGRASFTFSGEHDSLILNNFDVDRD
jgi:hypothetical protein